jgi:hypothetical protein
MSVGERERLKVLHQVEEGHLRQIEAARHLGLTDWHVQRLQARLRTEGIRGSWIGCDRRSNWKIAEAHTQGAVRKLRQPRYGGFGPTLAAERPPHNGIGVNRDMLRKWMGQAGLWQPRRLRVKSVHVWRPR